jgi:hypothetical protein
LADQKVPMFPNVNVQAGGELRCGNEAISADNAVDGSCLPRNQQLQLGRATTIASLVATRRRSAPLPGCSQTASLSQGRRVLAEVSPDGSQEL